jgi:hypothetical protein
MMNGKPQQVLGFINFASIPSTTQGLKQNGERAGTFGNGDNFAGASKTHIKHEETFANGIQEMGLSNRSDDDEDDLGYRQVNYSKIRSGDRQSTNKPVAECEIIDWSDQTQIRKTKLDVVANLYTSNTQYRTSIDGLRLNSN